MQTERHLEPGEEWGVRGEEWGRLERLLELARSVHREELSEEQRVRIRARVLACLEQRDRARRRRARAFLVSASALLVVGLVAMVVRHA